MPQATFTPARDGKSNLMLGSVVCTTMLAGAQSSDELTMVICSCPKGTGPGPHTDPWRESFLVLDGDFEFQLEQNGRLIPQTARPGDTISIPAGVGHAFRATSEVARTLILSVPGGLDAFFAAAGEPTASSEPPAQPQPFDRARFEEATRKYEVRRFEPVDSQLAS
jgi:quercetin dioxygenase-like cupin family protein